MFARPVRLLHELLQRTAERLPEKVVIISGNERLSYAQLWQYSAALASTLKEMGVRRGNRVLIFLDNTWQSAVAIYGTLMADAAFVLVNPQTKRDKLAYILNDCTPGLLIADARLWREFWPAVVETRSLRGVLTVGQVPVDTHMPVHPFDQALEPTIVGAMVPQNITLDLAGLIYTSGSTGEPKGVMHTHQSMLFALHSVIEYLRLDESDRLLCVLPLAFDYGLYQLLMTVTLGATLVLEQTFTYLAQVLQVMEAEAVTVFPGVPTAFAVLLAAHERRPLCFPEVRRVTNTAAALPSSFNRRLREVFPRADIYRMYGLTECKRVSYLPPEQIEQRPESVGIAIPGTEVLVLDDAGRPVAPGEIGTLYVRGPHVMQGYWNQPEKSAYMLKSGSLPGERVLCTHDLFTVDEDGYLYFIGRTDDIIKTRGEKVSPLEIEKALYEIPGIREAAVLGLPDPVLGEAVYAFASLLEGSSLNERQIQKHCADRLEPFMVPKRVLLVPALPRTANGKISRQLILERYASSVATSP